MAKRRDLIKMTPEEIDDFLHGRRSMTVGTFSPDGSIHLVAMWYGFVDGNPAFETYAKSQKVKNLQRDPRITVLVEAGDRYEELRGVELVGKAIIHDDTSTVMAVAKSVIERYWEPKNDEEAELMAAGLANKRVAVEVVPEKIVSWNHAKLGGTY
jgi:PPOX class probable F420-dependent enzyme